MGCRESDVPDSQKKRGSLGSLLKPAKQALWSAVCRRLPTKERRNFLLIRRAKIESVWRFKPLVGGEVEANRFPIKTWVHPQASTWAHAAAPQGDLGEVKLQEGQDLDPSALGWGCSEVGVAHRSFN